MNSTALMFLLAYLVATLVSGQPPIRNDFKCIKDEDCNKYNYCQRSYSGFTPISSQCVSNTKAPFGLCQVGDHLSCQSQDSTVELRASSTVMCFQVDGKSTCHKSYYMPCKSNEDCAFGFRCQSKNFKDGPASICVPSKMYQGGGEFCQRDQDCGYGIYFGHKWMPCGDGTCLVILA